MSHRIARVRGFSLLEVLLVVGLIAVTGVLAAAAMSGGFDRIALQSTSKTIAAQLRAIATAALAGLDSADLGALGTQRLGALSSAQIGAMASEHGYQVWIEVVSANGAPAIFIEDGSVVGV